MSASVIILWKTGTSRVCIIRLSHSVLSVMRLFVFVLFQGKFIRIHFGTNGKIAGADIETCTFRMFKFCIVENKFQFTCGVGEYTVQRRALIPAALFRLVIFHFHDNSNNI